METLIDIRSEILDLSHLILEKINKIYEDNDKHPIFKKIAEHYKERLKEIEKICSISKYNLYLIGSAGIGKSTLLSTLLNLIDYDKLVIGEKLSDCLFLKIGTGQITICETSILFRSENTKFEIIPSSSEEFKGILRDFVGYLFEKPTNLSMEEIKAIKNMLHIPRKENTEKKMLSYLGFIDNKDIDVLVNDLFAKIKYESRTKTEIMDVSKSLPKLPPHEVYPLHVHEIENLIPFKILQQIMEEQLPDMEAGLKFLKELQEINDGEPVLYYDFKNGFPYMKEKAKQAYWKNILLKLGKDNLKMPPETKKEAEQEAKQDNQLVTFPSLSRNKLLEKANGILKIKSISEKENMQKSIDGYLDTYWDEIGLLMLTWGCANLPVYA